MTSKPCARAAATQTIANFHSQIYVSSWLPTRSPGVYLPIRRCEHLNFLYVCMCRNGICLDRALSVAYSSAFLVVCVLEIEPVAGLPSPRIAADPLATCSVFVLGISAIRMFFPKQRRVHVVRSTSC
jgi:hypothetical protein